MVDKKEYTITITVKIPWYLRLYLLATRAGCAIGLPINQGTVANDTRKMIKIETKTNPQ